MFKSKVFQIPGPHGPNGKSLDSDSHRGCEIAHCTSGKHSSEVDRSCINYE